MTEQQTPVMEATAAEQPRTTPPAGPPQTPKKKKKKKMPKALKIVIALIIVAAVVIAIGVILWMFVFRENTDKGEAMTDVVMRGSIQSMVEGSGLTKAKDAATITPNTGGTIEELFVKEGDVVTEGQPLYTMDDTTAQDAVTDAQKTVDNCTKELQAVYDKIAELTITAPHAGNLREVGDFKIGDTVSEGTTIATLVNDTKLRLSLYYSYAYEDEIHVGQSAQISIPATMGTRSGTVESINKVRYVTPEGAIHFEVVFVMDNPGTLTEGMDASAAITASDGTPIYPYENGTLEYYETTVIKAKATGPVESVNLLNYADVRQGQVLVQLGAKDTDTEIATQENALKAAQEKLDEALEELGKYNAVAPISGTVLTCNLVAGQEVTSGQAITIADTSVMTIEISVDERNIQYVKAGMMVDIEQYGNYYMGIVESVALTGNAENGMSTFPAVVKVDNPDGMMMSNTYANYSFVASQSEDCLTVPVQAVKYVSFANIPGMLDGMGGDTADPGMTEPGLDGGMADPGLEDGGDALPEESGGESEAPAADDGAAGGDIAVPEAVPQSYTGGAAARPLSVMVMPATGGSISMGGSSSGGSMGASGGSSDDGTGYVVFVKAAKAPENAILEPDPAWECPEGFWTVPVEVGLSDSTRVEIISGLNEGDEVFIGYATDNANSYGY